VKAGQVAPLASFISVYRAWPATQLYLHAILIGLSVAEEAGIRMRAAPDGYNGCSCERSHVHARGIHTDHQIQVADQVELVGKAQLIDNAANPRISGPPLGKGHFLRSAPNKENTDGVGAELLNQFFHFLVQVYLLPVFGKRCNSDEEAGLRIAENMFNF